MGKEFAMYSLTKSSILFVFYDLYSNSKSSTVALKLV